MSQIAFCSCGASLPARARFCSECGKASARFLRSRHRELRAADREHTRRFLVAGLVWGLTLGEAGFAVKLFFLACVVVAGIFGAATVSRRILYVQALPAALAIVALWMGW